MLELNFRKSKVADGEHSITYVRADGSETWQASGDHFVYHDLTHYAVETGLGLRESFLGLLPQGWDLGDFEGRDDEGRSPRERLNKEAVFAERVVGLYDLERYSRGNGFPMETDFVGEIGCLARGMGVALDGDLAAGVERIAALRDRLFGEWKGLGPGETMRVVFGEE